MKHKDMQNREISREERDLVAAFFLNQRERADTEQFAKVGEQFVENKLVLPARRSDFHKAIAKLEEINCHREVLFRSLYRIHSAQSRVAEFPHSDCAASLIDALIRVISEIKALNETMASSIWQGHEKETTTFHAAVCRELESGSDQEMLENDSPTTWSDVRPWSEMTPELLRNDHWLDSLATRVDLLARIDQDRIFKEGGVPPWLRALAFAASQETNCRQIVERLTDPATTDCLQMCKRLLVEYSSRPRKDVVESYARARCCAYPTVATGGQPHLELVADVLNSFENTTQDAELLRKNLKNFKAEHPFCSTQMEFSLREEHENARSQSGRF